jgi:hypothetical protein
MTTLENYKKETHNQFTHSVINIDGKLYFVHKTKGYTEKSTIFGSIFHITQGENLNIKLKTKKQVLTFLSNI